MPTQQYRLASLRRASRQPRIAPFASLLASLPSRTDAEWQIGQGRLWVKGRPIGHVRL